MEIFDDSVIDYLIDNYPKKVIEIKKSLLVMSKVLDSTIYDAASQINNALNEKDFEKMKYITEQTEKISKIQKKFEIYSEYFVIENEQDYLTQEKGITTSKSFKQSFVNGNVPHRVDEEFRNSVVCAFSFNNENVSVRSWREVLHYVCKKVIEINRELFLTFPTDPDMFGRTSNYFSKDQNILRASLYIAEADIYVETNLSANGVISLVRKILRKYNINTESVRIYLRER